MSMTHPMPQYGTPGAFTPAPDTSIKDEEELNLPILSDGQKWVLEKFDEIFSGDYANFEEKYDDFYEVYGDADKPHNMVLYIVDYDLSVSALAYYGSFYSDGSVSSINYAAEVIHNRYKAMLIEKKKKEKDDSRFSVLMEMVNKEK